MGKPSNQSATFDGLTITFRLKKPIEMDIFRVDDTDYAAQLRTRNLPKGLELLIGQLFERGAITKCSISYGQRVDLRLAELDQQGRTLLAGRRLERFQAAFAEITGEKLAANWQSPGSMPGRRASDDRDYGTLVNVVASLVDAVANGIELAAAIKILTDD